MQDCPSTSAAAVSERVPAAASPPVQPVRLAGSCRRVQRGRGRAAGQRIGRARQGRPESGRTARRACSFTDAEEEMALPGVDAQPRQLRGTAAARHSARHRAGDHVSALSPGQTPARPRPREMRRWRSRQPRTVRVDLRASTNLAFEPVTVAVVAHREPPDHVDRSHEDVSRAAQALRRAAALRRDADRRARARAGRAGGPGAEGRADTAVRCTAFRGARRISSPPRASGRPGARSRTRTRCPTSTRRSSSACATPAPCCRQAVDGIAGAGRRLVRRHDAQSMDARHRLQRIVGGPGRGDRRRPRRLRARHRNARLDHHARRASAASSACVRPTGASAATARWRSAGRWTRSDRCAGASRTARWCSTRSTAPTAATTPSSTRRSSWNPDVPLSKLRIGYVASGIRRASSAATRRASPERLLKDALGRVAARPARSSKPIDAAGLPDRRDQLHPRRAEAAAAFDDLTRSKGIDQLTEQGPSAWPNTFRTSRFIPAVEYIRAQRARRCSAVRWTR